MKISRTARLNGEYRKEISAIISGKLKNRDPRLTGLISVTEADVAPDLKTANIYVSIFSVSDEQKKLDFAILKENAAFIRHELSKVMRMRTVPALTFKTDGSMEYGSKMDELFKKIHKDEPDTGAGAPSGLEYRPECVACRMSSGGSCPACTAVCRMRSVRRRKSSRLSGVRKDCRGLARPFRRTAQASNQISAAPLRANRS